MSGDYSPQFSIKHMHKDLRLALAHAKSLDLTLAETTTVQGLYAEAEKRGFGDLDFAALLDLVRNP
jgi:2-hydroxy-3-oxopropionate reductase